MLYLWSLVGLFFGISPLYFFESSFVSLDLFFLVCTPVWKQRIRGKKKVFFLSLFWCYGCLSVFNVALCLCAWLGLVVFLFTVKLQDKQNQIKWLQFVWTVKFINLLPVCTSSPNKKLTYRLHFSITLFIYCLLQSRLSKTVDKLNESLPL